LDIYQGNYYHLYNCSNNNELIFKSKENYIYLLQQYRKYLSPYVDTIAYCLMPTHFHILIYVKSADIEKVKRKIGDWLSSYTKSINKKYNRKGSLFKQHSKVRIIKNDRDLITVVTYIHQNPVRACLVDKLEEWSYSSYKDYIGMRKGRLPKTDIIYNWVNNVEEYKKFSETILHTIDKKYWI
jgi:putative transposase